MPRSMTLLSDPVWRDRWNRRSKACRCSKVRIATDRMVRIVTCSATLEYWSRFALSLLQRSWLGV